MHSPEKNDHYQLGAILVRFGMADETSIARALIMSHDEKRPIGEAFVKLGIITGEQLIRCLAYQKAVREDDIERAAWIGSEFVETLTRRLDDIADTIRKTTEAT